MEATLTEENDELSRLINKSEHSCDKCGDSIQYTDEIYMLQVVQPYIQNGELLFGPVQADDGDFLYEPCFLEFSCWEELEEEMRDELENQPPILDDYSILDCAICDSGIRQWEFSGLAVFGEMHCSRRTPEGAPTSTFSAQDPSPTVFCISCLKKIDDKIELWGEVEQNGECSEGTFIRCWRYGCDPSACQLGLPPRKTEE